MLRIAIPKGRVQDSLLPVMQTIGIDEAQWQQLSTHAQVQAGPTGSEFECIEVRGWDIPSMVVSGICDLGIVGNDILAEVNQPNLYVPLDLGVARCKMQLAVKKGSLLPPLPRVACRFVRLTQGWFDQNEKEAIIVPVMGAHENAASAGWADGIVDLVATGRSLRQHNLEPIATLMEVSAQLVVNAAAMRLKGREVRQVLDTLVRHKSSFEEPQI